MLACDFFKSSGMFCRSIPEVWDMAAFQEPSSQGTKFLFWMTIWEGGKIVTYWKKISTFLRTRILKCCLQKLMQYFCLAFQNKLKVTFHKLSEPWQPQQPSSLDSSHSWKSGSSQANCWWGRQVSMETCLVSVKSN